MENLTHSLVGATLAELALPPGATRTQRRAFFVIGVVAANLPDADLLYTRIAPPPLGYLLHHRGHTHTVGGLVAQALLLGAVCLVPAVWRHVGAVRLRLAALIVAALASHLVLDSWNSYGVHPFWPFESRWYYGDAIYILEPWLWLLLGVSATLNTMNRWGRWTLGAALGMLAIAATALHVIPAGALVALMVAAVVVAVAIRHLSPRGRAGVALAATTLFVVSMFGVRQRVRGEVLAAMDAESRGALVDVVLNPQAANPLCWSALTISEAESRGEYVTRRATATPFGHSGCGGARTAAVAWEAPVAHSLLQLRELYGRNCRVRAWMRFGRAPEAGDGYIGDLRFGSARANFTTMRLDAAGISSACPRYLPKWGTPRADLVGHAAD